MMIDYDVLEILKILYPHLGISMDVDNNPHHTVRRSLIFAGTRAIMFVYSDGRNFVFGETPKTDKERMKYIHRQITLFNDNYQLFFPSHVTIKRKTI